VGLWQTAHLTTLLLGTLCIGVAASAGVMYLHIDRRLRRKRDMLPTGRVASLEAIERLIIRAAAAGFGLFTLALATGFVLGFSRPHDTGWWHVKVALSAVVWLIYAVVMNARYATHFRGRRAAWLSVAGLLLLLVTWAVATRLPGP
jgi:ABC-type uncharacterized transport system permease subunit